MSIKLLKIKHINVQLVAVVIYLLLTAGVFNELKDSFLEGGQAERMASQEASGTDMDVPPSTISRNVKIFDLCCVIISYTVLLVYGLPQLVVAHQKPNKTSKHLRKA